MRVHQFKSVGGAQLTTEPHLKVVVQGNDVRVPLGNTLQDRYLIAHLLDASRTRTPSAKYRSIRAATSMGSPGIRIATHHVLPSLHEFLVDDLACVVFARLDVDGLLHDGIGPTSKGFSRAILTAKTARSKHIVSTTACLS